ncbi:hypothetical protein V500_11108 [Pseudogymnoascus sp. VKM F-4518 (FW-2643)]|nr:hypothetical protein V500_11108 [Pseudogymnoascus sp. VKM F-4518 (FW-2643)]
MMLQVGDFITIAMVAARAAKALNDAQGSKAEFTSLLKTLNSLAQAMLQAEALCMGCQSARPSNDPASIKMLESIAAEIIKERKDCEDLITQFLNDFAAYSDAFVEQTSGIVRKTYRKLTWLGRKEEAAALEKRITTHMQALQLRLYAFCFASMKSDVVDNSIVLGSIDTSVESLAMRFGDMHLMVAEAVKRIEVVQNTVTTSIGYSWGPEAPIILIDGLDRRVLLPLMLASTPDTFREVLLIMHRGGPGYDKIESGKYVVSDEDFGGALIPHSKWSASFQPGKRIALSFILRHPGLGDEKQCPRCRTMETWLDDQPGRRRCLKCHLTFKIEDQERTRLFWKSLKPRPKPPTQTQSTPSLSKKSKDPRRPLRRSSTIPQVEYAHQYRRVHYQRDILRQPSVEQRWQSSDPEFGEFLGALSPVHRAAATGNVEMLDELLNDGANEGTHWKVPPHSMFRHDRTGWDFTGAPPIHFAAYYGHNAAVLYLLSCGANIDAKDSAGTTALHGAAWTGNEGLFKMLIKKGADKSVCDYDGWSVAIYAMSQGHDGISRLLLGEAGDADTEMLVKTYKLRHAAKLGNTDAVLGMLLEDQEANAADPSEDADATTELFLNEALIGAAEGGHVELVRTLLGKGADPCATDDTGSTALHWAGWGGHAEIGNQLYDGQEQGEDVESRLRITSQRHEEAMSLLLGGGADINARNVQGCTPLHWVSGAGSVPMMKFFVDQGADPEIEDFAGRTAVERARETGDEGVFGELAG